jgi:hypothetical protein
MSSVWSGCLMSTEPASITHVSASVTGPFARALRTLRLNIKQSAPDRV